MTELENIGFILEILGIVAFAISGAMVGIEKKMDIFGVAIMGMVTAVGGGVMRDVMIGIVPPTTLNNPLYSLVSLGVSVVVFLPCVRKLLFKNSSGYEAAMLLFDSVGLGTFVVTGAMKTIAAVQNPNMFLLLFMGLISGTGGSILRDVIAQKTPDIFVKHFYACAALIGALVFSVLWYNTDHILAVLGGVFSTIALRFLAATYRWNLPRAE